MTTTLTKIAEQIVKANKAWERFGSHRPTDDYDEYHADRKAATKISAELMNLVEGYGVEQRAAALKECVTTANLIHPGPLRDAILERIKAAFSEDFILMPVGERLKEILAEMERSKDGP